MQIIWCMLAGAAITCGVLAVYNWFGTVTDILDELADTSEDLRSFLEADEARVALLNSAITKLADEARASREAVERIESAVFAKDPEATPNQYSPGSEYTALYMEFKGQGKTDEQAAEIASQILNDRMESELGLENQR